MASRSITETFVRLQQQGQKALIPFIMAGDPDLETTALALKTLAEQGADLIEVGVPYADPLADGPVIQAAATRALRQGTTLEQVLSLLTHLDLAPPLILFSYYNPVLAVGVEAFLTQLQRAGVRGLVIPDLPLEESAFLLEKAQEAEIDLILLVAPTSPLARIRRIVASAQGFVYLVSLTGTTGVRSELSTRLPELIAQLRAETTKPIAVGFGIATPAQAHQVAQWGADGVIVGSACVRLLAETPAAERIAALATFCSQLKTSL